MFFTHALDKSWYVIVDQTSNKLDYIPEKHLFPHVEFPRNVRISVIFLTGPAVELSLNDLLLNWQLSRHWKHTHTHTSSIPFFQSCVLMSDVWNTPGGGAGFVLGWDLTFLETLSPASSLLKEDGFF